MRSLEEWFKYVESFDHTSDSSETDPQDDAVAAQTRVAAPVAPPTVAEPERSSDTHRSDVITRRYADRNAPERTFRAAPAPTQPYRPAPDVQPVQPRADGRPTPTRSPIAKIRSVPPPLPVPLPKESREQLLARLLDPILTLEEAAQVLDVCPTTVRRYTNKGMLQHYRTSGNQRRFRLSHVLKFLDSTGGRVDTGTLSEGPAPSSLARNTRVRVRSAH